jgi:hypothetical protein
MVCQGTTLSLLNISQLVCDDENNQIILYGRNVLKQKRVENTIGLGLV